MSLELETVPIIDSHQHLWDLDKLELAWLNDPTFRNLAQSFLLADYVPATSGLNIVKTVYMEVDARTADQFAEAEFILNLCRTPGSRVAGAVLGGRPGDGAFRQWIDRFRNNTCVKGYREVLFDRPAGYCVSEGFIHGVRQLGEMGWSFDIEIPAELLSDAIALIDACPHTQFILDHCCHPDLRTGIDGHWKSLVSHCAEHDNVAVKVSGAYSSAEPPIPPREILAPAINYLFNAFGPDRVIFGSDWPVVTLISSLRAWTEAVWDIVSERSPAEVQKLFRDNAVRIYRLG